MTHPIPQVSTPSYWAKVRPSGTRGRRALGVPFYGRNVINLVEGRRPVPCYEVWRNHQRVYGFRSRAERDLCLEGLNRELVVRS